MDIIIPSLSGLARMIQLLVISDYLNTGANPRNIEYVCPEGRLALITALSIQHRGGTAYARLGFEARGAGTGNPGLIFLRAAPALFETEDWTGYLWLSETDDLRSAADVGDATSDYRVTVSGVEFDWIDVI